MAEVFISYHVKSAEKLVRRTADLLEARGVSCWYSGRDMRPGTDFADIVPGEIRVCRVFLLILDGGAMQSDHVRREVGLADETDPLVLPFQTEKCEPSDWMAYYLKNVQVMNKPFRPVTEDRLRELADYIAEYLGKTAPPPEQPEAPPEPAPKPENHPAPPRRNVVRTALAVLGILLLMALSAVIVGRYMERGGQGAGPAEPETTPEETETIPDTAETTPETVDTTTDEQTESTYTSDGVILMQTEEAELKIHSMRKTIAASGEHIVGLHEDGTVIANGLDYENECDVTDWNDIVDVSAGYGWTVGLKSDGTTVSTGNNDFGQCDVNDWNDIVAVSAGGYHTIGLRSDRTVVAAGSNNCGQCDIAYWKNIVSISAGEYHTVGLRADGTVVATGLNEEGQCNVTDWLDIVAVSAGEKHTVGLRADGTVIAAGKNEDGQCNVTGWRNIANVSAGRYHTAALRTDGTVVTAGRANDEQRVENWHDIVAVCAGVDITIGLRKDGSLDGTGANGTALMLFYDWTNIRLPTSYVE